jgi:hypothetical protein
MCYKPKSTSGKIPRFAVKPINVFKVVWKEDDEYQAYYFSSFTYEKGKRYETSLKKWKGGYILDGFHSYSKKNVTCVNDGDGWLVIKSRKDGYKLEGVQLTPHLTIMKCHIPRWAKYYINKSGEMVSNRIVVDGFIDANEVP